MATTRAAIVPFDIHHDHNSLDESMDEEHQGTDDSILEDEQDEEMEDDEDDSSDRSAGSDEVVDAVVQEDMKKFQASFKDVSERFRLINRIGEGTFSTVYKAEDRLYEEYHNEWDIEERENPKWTSPPLKSRQARTLESIDEYSRQRRQPKYVAIKKIYVTSSPARIYNELELLKDLRGCKFVCPLITAFRCEDQVVAVLPYFKHTDFRTYFRDMKVEDCQIYFHSLFTALTAVHAKGILHRDIKPTNFLYDPEKKRGVLVDFGLAEWEGGDTNKLCLCMEDREERRRRVTTSVAAQMGPSSGYPRNESRPSRRANRAGTRGFRAPEVLLKCTHQTTKIDIWSVGVILLTIMSKRFPFFNSADDVEAMIEISTMFGIKKIKQCALLHGTYFETSIPSVGQTGFSMEMIILWSTSRGDDGAARPLSRDEKLAVSFLERCLELDPNKRISAEEALKHPFLKVDEYTKNETDELNMVDYGEGVY